MAPSSTTPNFSRPLRSPLSTGGLDTPVRGDRRRLALEELPHSATLSNMPGRALTRELSPSKLFEIATGSPRANRAAENNGAKHASSGVGSPRGRHNRKLSKISLKSTGESRATDLSQDLGGVDKPIINFRPQLWRHLDRNREVLNLDLFWPIKLDEEDDDDEEEEEEENSDGDQKGVFPFKELKPLKSFHNLHYLQLNGMMRSYQPIIWAVCWVNKNLTKVHLEMALEPEFCKDVAHKYRKIDEKWSYDPKADPPAECEYLGSHGQGILHEEFGEGEYLDQQAMKTGQMEMVKSLPLENMRYLPITELTLMNFVVDSGPFFRWFDPKKLKQITFRGTCFDGGFFLPDEMHETVKVNSPAPKPALMTARRVRPGEVKLIELKGGKVVSPRPDDQPPAAGLKTKLSQIMPKWSSKGKGKEKEATLGADKEGKEPKDKNKDKGKQKENEAELDTSQLERNLANVGL